MLGRDGYFYGTTQSGGTANLGTVFKITAGGSLTVLHNFTGIGSDGYAPYAPPIQATDGNFYGTTIASGAGAGMIYKITGSGTFTPVYQFSGGTDGAQPYDPLIQGTDGNFYGTTAYGGTGFGVVFKITPTRIFKAIHIFDDFHGAYPIGALVQGSDGNFYGTTDSDSSVGRGVIFKITPTGSFTLLHYMNGVVGGKTDAGLVQATDSNLYGAAALGGAVNGGTIFEVTPFSPLYSFDGTTGSTPLVTPLQHTDGALYGDTASGGTGNVSPCTTLTCGVFYRWSDPLRLKPFVTLLPYSGKVGDKIEFLGQGFKQSLTTVSFGTAKSSSVMVPTQYPGTYLTAIVPSGATTGPVYVSTSGVTQKSNKRFRVIPQITSFSPTSGPVGISVTIKGISLKQTTKVTFGGVPATSFTVDSDTQVTATVPGGAKTGKITVTTPGGTATSSGTFTVI